MDVILHYADEYVLDTIWSRVLTPATPSSPVFRAFPSLLTKFLAHDSTKLAQLAYAAHAQSGGVGSETVAAGAKSAAGGLLANWTNTLARAAASASPSLWSTSSATAAAGAAAGAAGAAGSAAAARIPPILEVNWDAITQAHLSALPRDNWIRQSISLYAITYVGILVLYFLFAGLSYKFVFNKAMLRHPRFLKNQVSLEIQSSLRAFPVLDMLTLPWFVGEVRGWSKLYERFDQAPFAGYKWGLGGWTYAILSVPFFLVFTDACIYWVHRLEHHPKLYKHVHKPHHKWLVPTPFASHAFHPLDGYAQSLPYHIFVYLFPLHKFIYMGLFVFVNLWSILIHDSDMICNSPLEKIINGPSHHTLHHLHFTVNYGQYFTGCDRLGGSYRAPKVEDDPLNDVKLLAKHDKHE